MHAIPPPPPWEKYVLELAAPAAGTEMHDDIGESILTLSGSVELCLWDDLFFFRSIGMLLVGISAAVQQGVACLSNDLKTGAFQLAF